MVDLENIIENKNDVLDDTASEMKSTNKNKSCFKLVYTLQDGNIYTEFNSVTWLRLVQFMKLNISEL